MRTAIILHGMPSKEEYFNSESPAQSNKHWLPWIQRQLILKGVLAQTIELPEPYEPVYEKWREVFEQLKVDEETILIGHSCGAGFLVRWLSEGQRKVGKVVLVAPFLDPDGDEVKSDFFHFEIDPVLIRRTAGVTVFVSVEDDSEILDSVEKLEQTLDGLKVIRLKGRGHFTFSEMRTDEFPELLEEILAVL